MCEYLVIQPEGETDHLGDLDIDGRIIFFSKTDLKEIRCEGAEWI